MTSYRALKTRRDRKTDALEAIVGILGDIVQIFFNVGVLLLFWNGLDVASDFHAAHLSFEQALLLAVILSTLSTERWSKQLKSER